jgi:hypothetical protein
LGDVDAVHAIEVFTERLGQSAHSAAKVQAPATVDLEAPIFEVLEERGDFLLTRT